MRRSGSRAALVQLLLCAVVLVDTRGSSGITLSIAHRGNSSAAPENTLAAFLSCVGIADVVEFDVQPTADGHWVVMHDGTVNRTTNGQGTVAGLTLAEIKTLDAGGWFSSQFSGQRVPTMAEAIDAILSGGMTPLVERKVGPADQFVRALQEQGVASQVVVQSFDWNFLGQVHALDPAIRLAALGNGNVTAEKLDQIQANGGTIANWTRTNTIPPFLEMVHARGMQMWSYVVNDQPTIDSMVAMGVDGIGTDYPARVTLATQPPTVVGRHVFYNNSAFDGDNLLADAGDEGAVAIDKQALLPGETASFGNYTSYNKGINGVIIDVQNLAGTPTVSDFAFKVGNSDNPASWIVAPVPESISLRPNHGPNQSDRITIIWADGAIRNQWLEISLLPTIATGLTAADTFYFGNAVGESGSLADSASVSILDEIIARNNPRSIANRAAISFSYDYNRDGIVSVVDQLLARNNISTRATELRLIRPERFLAAQVLVPEPGTMVLGTSAGLVGLLALRRRRETQH